MNFSINLTIIVQMLNFLVAFYILKKFLFSAAVKKLEHDELALERLESDIAFQDKEILKKELKLAEIQSDAVFNFSVYFRNVLNVFRPKSLDVDLRKETAVDKKTLSQKLTKIIIDKAEHGI